MKEIILGMGEHTIKVGCDNQILMKLFNRYYRIPPQADRTDISVNIQGDFGRPFVDYNVKITKEANKISFRRADYLIESDLNYQSAIIHVHDELALKHALYEPI